MSVFSLQCCVTFLLVGLKVIYLGAASGFVPTVLSTPNSRNQLGRRLVNPDTQGIDTQSPSGTLRNQLGRRLVNPQSHQDTQGIDTQSPSGSLRNQLGRRLVNPQARQDTHGRTAIDHG
ncbi:unnamed protein product [Dicrocoelium dendriticum]|nr:unnamed protein product [Dicrocoelium dendriticum]